MLADIVNTMFLYKRPTVGPSIDISVTQAAGVQEFFQQGLYLIQNMGPNIAYIRMHHQPSGGTFTMTIKEMPLFPYGSYDMSQIPIQIGLRDVKNVGTGLQGGHPPDLKYLHHICATGETATLRATRLTKD